MELALKMNKKTILGTHCQSTYPHRQMTEKPLFRCTQGLLHYTRQPNTHKVNGQHRKGTPFFLGNRKIIQVLLLLSDRNDQVMETI